MTDLATQPLESTVFERPPPISKAAARAQRRQEKAAKNQRQASKPLEPKNATQADYIDILREGDSTFAIGPAGTGKTYIAARIAAQRLLKGDVEKIVVSRVTASKKEHAIGFLPGNIDAKMKPWMIPVLEGLRAEVSAAQLDMWRSENKFEIVPFEYMRGRTFEKCVVILDEAQNATFSDLELLVTRTGNGTQMVIAGDHTQVDIPNSGLETFVTIAEDEDIMDVIEFSEEDVVRSVLAKKWVIALAKHKRDRKALEETDGIVDNLPSFVHKR